MVAAIVSCRLVRRPSKAGSRASARTSTGTAARGAEALAARRREWAWKKGRMFSSARRGVISFQSAMGLFYKGGVDLVPERDGAVLQAVEVDHGEPQRVVGDHAHAAGPERLVGGGVAEVPAVAELGAEDRVEPGLGG